MHPCEYLFDKIPSDKKEAVSNLVEKMGCDYEFRGHTLVVHTTNLEEGDKAAIEIRKLLAGELVTEPPKPKRKREKVEQPIEE